MSKKTLNQANLKALGAERLAALLIEVSTGSADIKRRLRLELSHSLGPAELAHDVRKRLVSLRKSTSFVGWRRRKGLIKDLNTQLAMIVEKIAPQDPAIAFDLLWQFIQIAPSVYGRVDDSRGDVGDVFRTAKAHFAEIAPNANLDAETLADRVWAAMQDNGYGEWDGIIGLMAPSLGTPGLTRLKAHIEGFDTTPTEPDPDAHEAIQFLRQLRGGTPYGEARKTRFVKSCLQEIAAAMGDTSAYIAQFSAQELQRKDIAAEVAQLLLTEDRADTALQVLTDANQDTRGLGQEAWDGAKISALIALGRVDEAQSHRWACFTATLGVDHLRAYLKLLPDFDDVEAEDRAKAHVLEHPNISAALQFCLHWPDLFLAAQLLDTRGDEIDGNHYTLLTPAAEALRQKHPRAAVLLWRKMIDHTLEHGLSSRYGHAADNLTDCAALDDEIADYGAAATHAQYFQALRTRHERKTSFWKKLR